MNENYRMDQYDIEDTARLMTEGDGGSDKATIISIVMGAAGILLVATGVFLIVL